MLALLVGSATALRPTVAASSHKSVSAAASRRNVLGAAAAALLSPSAVSAFNLPPPTEVTDPEKRQFYAALENPEKSAQVSPALSALNNDDMESLQAMAKDGWALTELADEAGRTVLHRAALIGNEDAVRFMLKLGSPIDTYSNFKETPLHLAIRNNRLECVRVLVEAGASTSLAYGTKEETALMLAEKYKLKPIIEYLKSKGAPGSFAGYPCLSGACTYGV